MNKIDLKSLAKRQWQDYQQNNPGTFFSTEKNTLSLEEAYKVQKEYMEWMVASHTGKNSQGLCDKIEEAMGDFEEAMG